MAGGNLGDLWFQLGVKDNTSKSMNAILKSVQGLDGMINKLNKMILDSDSKSKGAFKSGLSNALDYLNLLQKIGYKLKDLESLKSINSGIDTRRIDEAKKSLREFRDELIALQSGKTAGGVDSAFMTAYSKKYRNILTDIKEIERAFNKENTLSVSKNNAARLNRELENTKNKLAEIYNLQSKGFRSGVTTTPLLSGANSLRGVKKRMETMLGDDKLLANESKVRSLLSDIAYAYTKAAGKVREYKAAVEESSSVSSALGQQKIALSQIESILSNIDRLKGKSLEVGTDTTRLSAVRSEIERIKASIEGFTGKQLLNKGFGESLNELKVWRNKVNDILKDQSAANQRAKTIASDDARKLESTESRLRSLLELVSDVNKRIRGLNESIKQGGVVGADTSKAERAMSRLIEMRDKFNNADAGNKKQVADLVSEYKILKNEISNAKSTQDKLNTSIERINKNNSNRLSAELEIARQRIQSVTKALNNLQEKRFTSKMLGLDVSDANAKIESLKRQLRELEHIKEMLSSGNVYGIGRIGSIGNGREVQAANNIASTYEKANREVQRGIELEQKRQQEIAKTAAKVQSDLVRGFEAANRHAGGLNSTVQDLKSLFLQGGLVFGAQQFAMSIVTTGGEMEKQHIALQSILGDLQNANTMFAQTKELALNSPFTFSELNRDVKQLAAYGVEYENLYDTTKRLADMASGLGVGFDRIALAFGQVQARGWLDGKELRQISYAGIPLLGKLSEMYSKREGRTVTTSEIKKMISAREVGFEDVKQVFWDMTNEGGQFYNMQLTLSETLLGRYNKLKDAWEIMLSDFASGNSLVGKFFKTAIEGVTTLVQSIHTLSMPIGTIFAGYALKKAFAGNVASGFLSNKAKLASDIQNKVLLGEKLTQIEQRILVTKNQITGADLRALANARALTMEKLNQLRLSGKITAEQYKTYRGIVLRQTGEKTLRMEMMRTLVTMRSMTMASVKSSFASSMKGLWSGFTTSALASFRIIGTGIKALGATIWSAIGGLPGLVMTGLTFGIMYAVSEYQELSRRIEQTQDELADKLKQIREFLSENSEAYSNAISNGTQKEIDGLIETYKEKLKELAPYNYLNILMGSEERKDHKERLKYLDEEIKKLKEAQDVAKIQLNKRKTYSSLEDRIETFSNFYKFEDEGAYEKIKNGADKKTARWDLASSIANQNTYNSITKSLKEDIMKSFGDISKSEETRLAAIQAMNSIFSTMGVSDEHANKIRASVLQAFGIGDEDPWLKSEVSSKMRSMIDEAFPEIGAKIRASIPLNDAEKAKVKELMDGAKQDLIYEYPTLESTLQNLLASSRFEAVISLVFATSEKFNDLTSELVGRIPGNLNGLMMKDTSAKYRNFAKKWGKDNSWYTARNIAKSDIDDAYNEYKSAIKSKSKDVKSKRDAWILVRDAARNLLYLDYTGEDKKSNKQGRNGGHKEDEQLKRLKERISLYKKMYEEINKFKSLYGTGALAKLKQDGEFSSIFDNQKLFPISDYENYEKSINELLKTIPANTKDRQAFVDDEHAGIQSKNRALEQEAIRDGNKELSDRLNLLVEEYETYKKLYEVTGDKNGSMSVAFGGIVQYDSVKDALKAELEKTLQKANEVSGNKYTSEQVLGMSETEFKKAYGEDSKGISVIYNLYRQQSQKVKQETLDLLTNIIEKNATIAQQIEDENRSYERQKQLIAESNATAEVKERAKEGLKKTHNENVAKLQFEQFKQESDWVTIFDDLDGVSTSTIDNMITKIDEFSRTTGLSVESIKQLRDALEKLKAEQIERNPLTYIFGGVRRGNAIGDYLAGKSGPQYMFGNGYVLTKEQSKKMGLESGVSYTKNQLETEQKKAYTDSSKAVSELANKMQALSTILDPVINLFKAMGEEDSILGQITGAASGALSSAASTAGAFDTLGKMKGFEFLQNAGPYAAAASAALSIGGSLIKAFGADYSEYNKAKAQYENLASIWDSLISKKTEYMNIHWGTEATEASKEAQEMLKAEIEQTRIIAQKRLASGTSAGSHSIGYRMWKGSYGYEGKNWRDVAGQISSKYGVQFNGMEDLLNMDADTLSKIKKEHIGLWSSMDSDFRDYLEKLIEYGEKADDMIESLTEKLTGNKFSDLVSSWGDAMSTMANSSDNLVDHFEENLKKTILNSMIENIYGDKIKALLKKTQSYAENNDKIKDSNGNVVSEYTASEYADIKGSTDDLAKQIEATREYLRKTYGWSDNSSSSSRNSVKSITEETGDLIASYLNSIRLDVSVLRDISNKYYSGMSEIAKSQLTQLNMIAQYTQRNAEAAEKIETTVYELNSNFNRVINGTKQVHVK